MDGTQGRQCLASTEGTSEADMGKVSAKFAPRTQFYAVELRN